MLVLKRKLDESIMIGDNIEITILSVDRDGVRIGIQAPKEMSIYRKELYLEIQEENRQAVEGDKEKIGLLNELFRDLGKKD